MYRNRVSESEFRGVRATAKAIAIEAAYGQCNPQKGSVRLQLQEKRVIVSILFGFCEKGNRFSRKTAETGN